MSSFELTSLAIQDLEEIESFVAQDSPAAARRVLLELQAAMERLAEFPNAGHRREDAEDSRYRFWNVYSYLIVYAPDTIPVRIIRVISGYRDLPAMESLRAQPLAGRAIAVTRRPEQAEGLAVELAALGAEVIEAPTLAIGPMEDYAAVDAALSGIAQYAWLVVSSANAVDAILERLVAVGGDISQLATVQVAAVGLATAERLAEHGIRVDLVPDEAVGEALAAALIEQGVAGKRVLLLRAETGRTVLVDALRGAGAACDDLALYRTVCPASLPAAFVQRLEKHEIDWITLTSPSSFHNLLALLGSDRVGWLHGVKLASIGPVTTQAMGERGFAAAAEADPHDVSGLIAAIVRRESAKPRE